MISEPVTQEVAPTGSRPHGVNRWLVVLYILLCFEMGIFLFVFPWASPWDHNFFAGHYRWVSAISENFYVRGAVSGLGLVDLFLAFSELWRLRKVLGLTK